MGGSSGNNSGNTTQTLQVDESTPNNNSSGLGVVGMRNGARGSVVGSSPNSSKAQRSNSLAGRDSRRSSGGSQSSNNNYFDFRQCFTKLRFDFIAASKIYLNFQFSVAT